MLRLFLLTLCSLIMNTCPGQYNWKLATEKNGIRVYLSDVAGSDFKAVKVECVLTGTYTKLVGILTNVSHFTDWVYNSKTSKILKQINPLDFTYYSVTHMPWPLSNRDLVIHMRVKTDSLPRYLTISGTAEPNIVPVIPVYVRVTHYKASWKVTMPTAQTIAISYLLEVDPGGSIPAWAANMFADKGPYGTFSNLAELLKK